MKLHLTDEQRAQRRKFIHRIMWANGFFAVTNLTIALIFGNIPCFFAGGLCGFVLILLWEHA